MQQTTPAACILVAVLRERQELAIAEIRRDRIAEEVIEEWISFQMALSNKRKYPTAEFNSFASRVRKYVLVATRIG